MQVFKDHSYPIASAQDHRSSNLLVDAVDGLDGVSNTGSFGSASTSDDASEEETEMTVIRRHPITRAKRALSHKSKGASGEGLTLRAHIYQSVLHLRVFDTGGSGL